MALMPLMPLMPLMVGVSPMPLMVGVSGNVLANKGGQLVKLDLHGTSFCFVASHLTAHEGQKNMQARNDSVADIMTHAKLGNRKLDIGSQFHHVFWMGDLNYRINIKRLAGYQNCVDDRDKEWESVMCLVDQIGVPGYEQEVQPTIVCGRDTEGPQLQNIALNTLHLADELLLSINKGLCFTGWRTALPCFKPTFKVLRNEPLTYNPTRIPSWCDRILWKSLPGYTGSIKQTSHESCQEFMSSDHKPVRSSFQVKVCAPLEQGELGSSAYVLVYCCVQTHLYYSGARWWYGRCSSGD